MLTVGGAISGYSEIGSARSTSTPAIVRMIDRTAAKIGRSMKKCEKRILLVRGELTAGRMDLALVATTVTPARTNGLARPPITTRSFGVRPVATTRRPRAMPPSVTGLATTLLSSPTVSTTLCAWSDTTAASGISSASSGPP